MKMYIYHVNGHEFKSLESGEEAYKAAIEQAKKDHAPIYKTVITVEEFELVKGWLWAPKPLDERFDPLIL